MSDKEIKEAIKKAYTKIAQNSESCCCCNSGFSEAIKSLSKLTGYSETGIGSLSYANLGLGCGNPTSIAGIKEGDTVLDLGCGAGFDCLLAAEKVGRAGKVIGVDMTKEMVDKARENAAQKGFKNVEFRLGEIENLPLPDGSVDWVISNCVLNLSRNKARVFEETFRVLKHGGELLILDLALVKPLPKDIVDSVQAYIGCIGGAELKDRYAAAVEAAGFENVQIVETQRFHLKSILEDQSIQTAVQLFGFDVERVKIRIREIDDSIASVKVTASKS